MKVKPSTPCFRPRLALASLALLAGGELHAADPVIYEPFAQTVGNLNTLAGGTGLSGNWTTTTNNASYPVTVASGSPLYGVLLTQDNRCYAGANPSGAQVNTNASISAGTTLSTAGLMAEGSELWFSFLYTVPSSGVSGNSTFGVALGTAALSATTSLAAGNYAVGVSLDKNTRPCAAAWTNGVVKGTNSGVGAPGFVTGATRLVVCQIQWGSGSETINVYLPSSEDLATIPAAYSTLTTAANIDQTVAGFNILSFGGKNATAGAQGMDEIRFGTSYADVVPVNNDNTPPTLAGGNIVDNKSGGPILTIDTVTYTVTFSEPMSASTVDVTDFENAGSPAATINSVTATGNPAVYQVSVTPGGAGTLQLQVVQDAVLEDFAGNALDTTSPIADDTTITVTADTTPPTLAGTDIVDNVSGGPIMETDSVIYTVTFSEAMNASTVNASDFENGGSPAATINSVTATANPAVFEVSVTPGTGAGTLQLQVAAGANLEDPSGNALDTTTAIADDTVITVNADTTPPTLAGTDIVDNVGGGPILAVQTVTYTVTFSEPMNASTVNADDFENGGSPAATINSVTATGNPAVFTVSVSPGGVGTLQLQVKAGATLEDLFANALVTSTPIADDTIITVEADTVPPSPDPMTFASAPKPASATSIIMAASVASDLSGPVQYYFENTTNSDFRDWSTDVSWTNTGLTTGTAYEYRVKAKDAAGNETGWSAVATATPVTVNTLFTEHFEEPVVSGKSSNGTLAPGWAYDLRSPTVFKADNIGLYNEDASAFSTPDGAQAAWTNYSTAILTATGITTQLEANVTYSLTLNTAATVAGGSAGYEVQLLAFGESDIKSRTDNGTVLASASGTVTTSDMSQAVSIVFKPKANNANLGKTLGVRLKWGSGLPLYDNVELTSWADIIPPTLTSIVDNKDGGPVEVGTPVAYTVTFSEDMNDATVTDADFSCSGSATYTIDSVTETSPVSGVFTVQVTPTSVGTLQLQINALAELQDAVGNNLDTTSTIADDTILTVVATPEIAVEQPEGSDVASGGSIDFGEVATGADASLVFTIRNSGNADLNLTGDPPVAVSGDVSDFTVTVDPSTPVAASGTTTFTVKFAPTATGLRGAVLTIANNDSDEGTFTINLAGTGIEASTDNYLSWANANSVTGGENGDSDNDGVKNLVEYALADGGERGLLSGNTITFTKRGAPYGNDLTYGIEISSDLSNWSTPESGVTETATTISYTFTPGSPVKNFARLKVVQAP